MNIYMLVCVKDDTIRLIVNANTHFAMQWIPQMLLLFVVAMLNVPCRTVPYCTAIRSMFNSILDYPMKRNIDNFKEWCIVLGESKLFIAPLTWQQLWIF